MGGVPSTGVVSTNPGVHAGFHVNQGNRGPEVHKTGALLTLGCENLRLLPNHYRGNMELLNTSDIATIPSYQWCPFFLFLGKGSP